MNKSCRISLSIIVITMNRSYQLIEALESCLKCNLPNDMEFIVINNGSIDDTTEKICIFKAKYKKISVKYYDLKENLGVGGGRALGFDLANGTILYFLDDDAVISPQSRETFFSSTLRLFERYPQIASITTSIYDEMLGGERAVDISSKKIGEFPCIFKFLGGSHFLRKDAFESPLYFNIKYGSEEYAPSIIAQENGFYHIFNDKIRIIHRPKVNKWVDGSEKMKSVLVKGIATTYATKKILYPVILHPLIYLGYLRRCSIHLKKYNGAMREANTLVKEICRNNSRKRIRLITVFSMYRMFGKTVF